MKPWIEGGLLFVVALGLLMTEVLEGPGGPPTSPPLQTHLAPSLAHDAGHTELPAVPKIATSFLPQDLGLCCSLCLEYSCLSVWLAPSHPSCFTLRRAFFKGPSASHPVPHWMLPQPLLFHLLISRIYEDV